MYITIDGCDITKQTQIIQATVFIQTKDHHHIANLINDLTRVVEQYFENRVVAELHSDEEFNLKTNKS